MNKQGMEGIFVGAEAPAATTTKGVGCDPTKTYKYEESLAFADMFSSAFMSESLDSFIGGKMVDFSCFAQNVGFFNFDYLHEWGLWTFLVSLYLCFVGFAYTWMAIKDGLNASYLPAA